MATIYKRMSSVNVVLKRWNKPLESLHHGTTVAQIGTVSRFTFIGEDLNNVKWFRSILPTGYYDRVPNSPSAFRKWEALKPTHIVSLLPSTELNKKAGTKPLIYWTSLRKIAPDAELLTFPMDKSMLLAKHWFLKLSETLDALLNSVTDSSRVIVHCSAGIGRTGFFLGALMIQLGLDVECVVSNLEKNMKEPVQPIKLRALRSYHRWREKSFYP